MQRNKVKRLLREAFSVEGERLPAGTDAVVVARHEANALAEREGLAGISRVLSQLIDRVVEPKARTRVTADDERDSTESQA